MKLTDASMHLLSQQGIGLLKLNIGHCVKITASGGVVAGAPHARGGGHFALRRHGGRGLVAIAQQCHELLALKIDGCGGLRRGLTAISYGCPELQPCRASGARA